jgi:hypothetical protein
VEDFGVMVAGWGLAPELPKKPSEYTRALWISGADSYKFADLGGLWSYTQRAIAAYREAYHQEPPGVQEWLVEAILRGLLHSHSKPDRKIMPVMFDRWQTKFTAGVTASWLDVQQAVEHLVLSWQMIESG